MTPPVVLLRRRLRSGAWLRSTHTSLRLAGRRENIKDTRDGSSPTCQVLINELKAVRLVMTLIAHSISTACCRKEERGELKHLLVLGNLPDISLPQPRSNQLPPYPFPSPSPFYHESNWMIFRRRPKSQDFTVLHPICNIRPFERKRVKRNAGESILKTNRTSQSSTSNRTSQLRILIYTEKGRWLHTQILSDR